MAVNCGGLTIPLEQFCVAWRKALRGVLDLPYNCHSYLLNLVTDTLSVFDEICKRSTRLIVSCVVRGSALVRSVARYGLTVARYNSFIGSNALFCCDRYTWSLDDLFRSNINLSNFSFANSRHNLINDKMKEVALFLYETPNILYHFWVRSSRKRDIQQKSQFSTPPCTKCVRGWGPMYGGFFRGSSVLPNRHSMSGICA